MFEAYHLPYRRKFGQSLVKMGKCRAQAFPKANGAPEEAPPPSNDFEKVQELPPLSTVTARRFCDQQEMSSQTATGRSLP